MFEPARSQMRCVLQQPMHWPIMSAIDLDDDHILPTMDDWEVYPKEAAAVGLKAIELGIARKILTEKEIFDQATQIIKRSRLLTSRMMEEGFIPEPPEI